MNHDAAALIRISKEVELELGAVQRVTADYARVPPDIPAWVRLRTQASLLHDFYTGTERVFCRIAQELNGALPNSAQWHRDLLRDMALKVDGIRPPVITQQVHDELLPYLAFWRLFRNGHTSELEFERMAPLDQALPAVSARFQTEVRDFVGWMRQVSEQLRQQS